MGKVTVPDSALLIGRMENGVLANLEATRYALGRKNHIEIEINGTIATIKIDLSKTFGRSASGKTTIIATTAGNVEVAPGVSLGVNCYKK